MANLLARKLKQASSSVVGWQTCPHAPEMDLPITNISVDGKGEKQASSGRGDGKPARQALALEAGGGGGGHWKCFPGRCV